MEADRKNEMDGGDDGNWRSFHRSPAQPTNTQHPTHNATPARFRRRHCPAILLQYQHLFCSTMTNNWLCLSIYAICLWGAAAFVPSSSASKRISISSSTSLYGVRSAVRRARDSLLSKDRTDKDLKDGIAFFYDRSSKLWEDVWGEHMHQ